MADTTLISLNPEQAQAVDHFEGPCLVTAAPGSGKTRVIVERTARLIEKKVDPQNILSITFTNKAAKEMKERLHLRLGSQANKLWIGTFHSFCARCLRIYGHLIGYGRDITILDEDEQLDMLASLARQQKFEWKRPVIKQIASILNDDRENLLDDIDIERHMDKEDESWWNIGKAYIDRLREKNYLDFTALLTETVRLFEEKPEGLKEVQGRFHWLQVDETQDTNAAQFRLVDLLGERTKNIFIVGDIDQTIFSWRGARPENITEFIDDYSPKIIRLGQNYRSTPQIVAVANQLIRNNPNRPADDFRTGNDDGPPVSCKCFQDPDEEARWIAKQCRHFIQEGLPPKEMAVLYRLNAMSRALEMAFVAERVPHVVIGAYSFFDRREVKDHLAMLRMMHNPHDGMAFHRIANRPKRDLGDVAIGKIEKFADVNKISILDACRRCKEYLRTEAAQNGASAFVKAYEFDPQGMSLSQRLRILSERLGYREFLRADDPEKFNDRTENTEELLAYVAQHEVKSGPDIPSLLDQIALMTSVDKSKVAKDSVSLQSMHTAKGLEFSVVFVVGVEEKVLPHSRAIDEREDGIFEERRLFYVAVTRAKKKLFVSYCQRRPGYGGGRANWTFSQPSRFLREAGLQKVT